MANTVAVQWSVLWLVLWCSSLFMLAASGADLSPPEEVAAYWDAALHGGSMPSTIRAMLSPLSAHQTTQLLLLITATTGYLPTHAASFCKAAHIQCGQGNNISDAPAAAPAGIFVYEGYHPEGRSAAVADHRKTATPTILPSIIKHRKAGPAALDPTEFPLAQATEEDVVHGSDATRADVDPEPRFFMYNHYGAGGVEEGENPGSGAGLAKVRRDGSDVPRAADVDPEPRFFMYNQYHSAGGVEGGENPASDAQLAKIRHDGSDVPRGDIDPEPRFFMYNQYGAGGRVKEGRNPGSDAELAKVQRASDADPESGFFMYNQYGGSGGSMEATSNPASTSADGAKVHASAVPLAIEDGENPASDADVEPRFFMYNNYGSGGEDTAKNPASFAEATRVHAAKSSPSDTTAAELVHGSDMPRADAPHPEPRFFMYNHYGAGGVEEGQNAGSDAELAKIRRASDADAEPKFFKNNNYGGSGTRIVGATRNPASTSVDAAARVHASAVPLEDGVDPRGFFMYNFYGSSGGVKATKSPAADDHMQTEAVRALLSSNIREIPGIFFREKQVLVSGVRIYVHLATGKIGNEDQRAFLPRKLAQVFPLSSQAAQNLSSMLGASTTALQGTLDACQLDVKNDMNAEVSACLTSLEDISDFVSSVMGSTTKPIHTYDSLLNASTAKFSGKAYYVESVRRLKQDPDEPAVTCHDMAFPFRVFYCHYVKKTMVFEVTLQGDDGTSHKRIAVCHYDTSYWNPKHISFAELHTKPGQAEACHWLGKSWMGQGGWVFTQAP